jgi:hypothetical protein
MTTMEVGTTIWKVINKDRFIKNVNKQVNIDINFKVQWYHLNIFGVNEDTIKWCFFGLVLSWLWLIFNVVIFAFPF